MAIKDWSAVDDMVNELCSMLSDATPQRGQTTESIHFGGYVGLGIVLKYLGRSCDDDDQQTNSNNNDEAERRIRKITSALFSELASFLTKDSRALCGFVVVVGSDSKEQV